MIIPEIIKYTVIGILGYLTVDGVKDAISTPNIPNPIQTVLDQQMMMASPTSGLSPFLLLSAAILIFAIAYAAKSIVQSYLSARKPTHPRPHHNQDHDEYYN